MSGQSTSPAPKRSRIRLRRKLGLAAQALSSPGNPRFASLFVTRACNFACPYCRSIQQPFKDITTGEWMKVIDKVRGWGARMFTLTGGEPLVRPDILEIVEHITSRKCLCWMISNFSLMTPKLIDELALAGLQFVTCSFDSMESIGEKADTAVLDLLTYARNKGIIASTLTVITSKNIHEVPRIVETVTRRGIIFDMGLYQHVGGLFSPEESELKPRREDVERLRAFLKRAKLSTGLIAPSWSYLNEDLDNYYATPWKCSAQRDSFIVINNDGGLMPCQEYETSLSVFDVQDLRDRNWRSQKATIVDSCKGCFYGCYHSQTHANALDALLDAYALLRV